MNSQMKSKSNSPDWMKKWRPFMWSSTLTTPNELLGDDDQQYCERSINPGSDTDDPMGAGPHTRKTSNQIQLPNEA